MHRGGDRFTSCWKGRLLAVLVIFTAQLLSGEATFRVFISSSQLESYFKDTEEFSLIKGCRLIRKLTRSVNTKLAVVVFGCVF